MKTDAIIIGSELDGLVAATRLCERGYSVRLFSTGAGSLHYSSDGIHVLGFSQATNEEYVSKPIEAISQLNQDHPYQKIGKDQTIDALSWYVNMIGDVHQHVLLNDCNKMVISPAGLNIPIYGTSKHQATIEQLDRENVTIVVFRGHRDFPAELIAVELGKKDTPSRVIQVDAPSEFLENAALAKSFDAMEDLDAYFATIGEAIPPETNVVLFPAVMGFSRHQEVLVTAERVLGMPCLEVPTLPPSIPGMRLEHAFVSHLKNNGISVHLGASISRSSFDENESIVIWDSMDRQYEASALVISSGGVLMGGLDVDSQGVIHETSLGLDTYQSEPLNAISVDRSLHALHTAGVETDNALRPKRNGSGTIQNVFVTGRTLAHWNPAAESSSEGVCVATGWAAAENAHQYLEEHNNG